VIVPRQYQQRARADLYATIRGGSRRTLLCLPPGAGKTLVAFIMFSDAAGRGRDTWFLAPRRGLVTQPREKFLEYSDGALRADVVMAGHAPDPSARVHVASIQTIEAREIRLPDNAVVFVDEAHLAHADDLISTHPSCLWIGLTATPQRENGVPIGDVWQTLVTGPTPSALVDLGVLAVPEVFTSSPPDGMTLRDWTDDHATVADPWAWWRRHADGLRTVAFCSTVSAAHEVQDGMRAVGIRAVTLTAEDTDDVREAAFRRLHDRTLEVVCVVGLCSEGWDAPWLECVIDLSPTTSLVRCVQRSARLHRTSPEATRKVHLDLAKNVWRHGLPLADRAWTLATGGRLLVDAPALRCCRSCGYLSGPSARCPGCGAEWEPTARALETVAAEVRRFTAATEADRAQRLADEERDRKRRRILHGIAYGRWSAGQVLPWRARTVLTRGAASSLAADWWRQFTASGLDWREFLRRIE